MCVHAFHIDCRAGVTYGAGDLHLKLLRIYEFGQYSEGVIFL
jgi:hypothetical protein